jgi:hypothetical protein
LSKATSREDFVSSIPIHERGTVTTVDDDLVVTYLSPDQKIGEPIRLFEPADQDTLSGPSPDNTRTMRRPRRRSPFRGVQHLMVEKYGVAVS